MNIIYRLVSAYSCLVTAYYWVNEAQNHQTEFEYYAYAIGGFSWIMWAMIFIFKEDFTR